MILYNIKLLIKILFIYLFILQDVQISRVRKSYPYIIPYTINNSNNSYLFILQG